MATITFNEQDLMRVRGIVLDRDKEDALAFICERIMPEVEKGERMKMKSHLEGGKGSMF